MRLVEALVVATALHLATLLLRSEAWRQSLAAIEERAVPRWALHLACAGTYAVGTVETAAGLPVRIALLRRLAPAAAPGALQMALADVPIFALEVVVAAVAAAFVVPPPLGPLAPAAAVAAIVAVRLAPGRLGGARLCAGLRVLACRRRRLPLTALVAALSVLTALRIGVILAASGLPAGPADVALVFVVLGVLGIVPIGVAAAPGAVLAADGASHLAAAAVAGAAIAGTTVAAVAAYCALAVVAAACLRRIGG